MTETNEPQITTRHFDSALVALTNVANRSPGFGLSITLTVGGSVVTGNLVGRNDWLDALAQLEAEENLDALQSITVSLRDALRFDVLTDDERPERFVHLAGARYVDASGSFNTTGVLWRGRLESVDGWSIGSIGSVG